MVCSLIILRSRSARAACRCSMNGTTSAPSSQLPALSKSIPYSGHYPGMMTWI